MFKTWQLDNFSVLQFLTLAKSVSLRYRPFNLHLISSFEKMNAFAILKTMVESNLIFSGWQHDVNSVRKRKLLMNDCYKTLSVQFFAIYILHFHKTEVQTVKFRCLMGLVLNWFKRYGLRCNLMPSRLLANSRKKGSYKWPFTTISDHFLPIVCSSFTKLMFRWSFWGT